MAYKLISEQSVRRLVDNANIPFAPGNKDYQEYLAWVALGNTPEPLDPPPPPDTRYATARQACQDVMDEPGGSQKVKALAQALLAIL